MATFQKAFDLMIINEGGYVNHTVAGDRGGQTYAGIARKFHPRWPGWQLVDKNDMDNAQLTHLVYDFYQQEYWQAIKGDDIKEQRIAESIFDFAVNAGVGTAAKLAQLVVGSTPDGVIGNNTLEKLNQVEAELFVTKYALAKVARYTEIVKRNRSQKKFLVGWLNRTLRSVA